MATTIANSYYSQSWAFSRPGTTPQVGTNGTNTVESWVTRESPPKKGVWTTINGKPYRLPTSYSTSELRIQRSQGENSSGADSFWTDKSWTTTAGGSTAQITANMGYMFQSDCNFTFFSGPAFNTQETNEATTKCLNNIADSKVNIAENLATLAQTARLFTGPARNLVKSLQEFHRVSSRRGIPRITFREMIRGGYDRKLAEWYLQWVYGVKPLMQDLYGLIELAKESGAGPLLLSGEGLSRREYAPSDRYFNDVSGGRDNWLRGNQVKARTRCSIWAKISDDYQGTRTLNRLNLLNPVSLVWELVPYSFLVDWVLPIGPVLQALTAPAGLDFVSGTRSRRVNFLSTHEVQHQYTSIRNAGPASSHVRYDGYQRQTLGSWPLPGLWVDHDPLRLSVDGSDRVFKALALSILALPRN